MIRLHKDIMTDVIKKIDKHYQKLIISSFIMTTI